MLEFQDRVWGNAHRISSWTLDPSVTTLDDGQWLTLNDNGNLVVAGAASKKAYITISSRRASSTGLPNNMGAPIQAAPARDTVSVSGKAIVLIGAFKLATDNYDKAKTYHVNDPLTVVDGGILAPVTDAATQVVVAHVCKVPASNTDTLGIVHE